MVLLLSKQTKTLLTFAALTLTVCAFAIDHPKATLPMVSSDRFTLVEDGNPVAVVVSPTENTAILNAAENLVDDFERVTGRRPSLTHKPTARTTIIIGSLESPLIKEMVKAGKFDASELAGCNEKYLIQTVNSPLEGVDEALVIAGVNIKQITYGIKYLYAFIIAVTCLLYAYKVWVLC